MGGLLEYIGIRLNLNLSFGRVTFYKRIRNVELTESIPKSPSGKIMRRKLVEMEEGPRGQRPA